MNDDRRLPEVPVSALRDHGDSERVERVWRRLEQDIPAASARPRSALWWAPAAVVIVFGAGVFVGARWFRETPAARATTVAAEPAGQLDQQPPSKAEAAGTTRTAPAAKPHKRRGHERSPAPATEPPVEQAPEEAPAPAATTATVAEPPKWQRLYNAGDFAGAHQALEEQGGFDSALASASAEQLISLADIAKVAGQRERELQILKSVIKRFPADPYASLAAYELGTMLENAGDHAGAAQAFRTYLRLSPKGDFADDALAKLVEIANEQGNLDQAQKLADQYAKDFPKGRHRGEIREQLAKAGAADAGARVEQADAGAPGHADPDDDDPGAAADPAH